MNNNKIKELLKNPRISDRVTQLQLTNEQLIDALPILIDMNEETDDENTKYLTSFKVNSQGDVVRIEKKSTSLLKEAYLDNIITNKLEPFTYDNSDLIKENGRASFMIKAKYFLENIDKTKKGLYLYGKYGVGKTFLLKRLAKKFASNGKTVAFSTTPALSQQIKKTFSPTYNGRFSSEKIIELFKEADYLFLDDIGAESISSWFRDDILFPILNYRMQRELVTFFSSNLSIEKLKRKESVSTNSRHKETDKADRLISRIRSLATEVEISGTNKRY